MNRLTLPADFTWGVATASYQIEGATREGGRSESIWDSFARKPGAVYAGNNGDVAVDHYHRYIEDLDLMKELGVGAYRFSIAWPRIIPEGSGSVNRAGVDFYKRLLDAMEERGLKAFATLYHWDLPQVLEDSGGWTNRKTAYAFAKYAEVCFREFGDRIEKWVTLNEPWCSAYLGYMTGIHAPGRKDLGDNARATHHLNLAHGLATRAFRESGLRGEIGIVWNLSRPRPASAKPEDIRAAEWVTDRDSRMFTGPVLGKGYPERFVSSMGMKLPIEPGDMEIIASKIDFAGLNYYFENVVAHDAASPDGVRRMPQWQPVTGMGWPVVPGGLCRLLCWLSDEAPGLPLYVTENGCARDDSVDPADGRVHDPERIEYLRGHFEACERAVADGVPLKGYFLWSFIDNFEWSWGYARRFGIVYCDYMSLKRIPKDSFYFYRDIIAGMAY